MTAERDATRAKRMPATSNDAVLAGLDSQRGTLEKVTEHMYQTIRVQRRIFLFGTGHSHLLAEEGFFRAGGLAPVVPIFSSALMVHELPKLSSHLERTPGLAGTLLSSYDPQPGVLPVVQVDSAKGEESGADWGPPIPPSDWESIAQTTLETPGARGLIAFTGTSLFREQRGDRLESAVNKAR